jgi:hypothetical protein
MAVSLVAPHGAQASDILSTGRVTFYLQGSYPFSKTVTQRYHYPGESWSPKVVVKFAYGHRPKSFWARESPHPYYCNGQHRITLVKPNGTRRTWYTDDAAGATQLTLPTAWRGKASKAVVSYLCW